MRIAIFASRGIRLPDLNDLLPENVTELLTCGPVGVGIDARNCARARGVPLREFPLEREAHGPEVHMARCREMIAQAEFILAFWDGRSRDIPHLLKHCSRPGAPFCVIRVGAAEQR